MYDFVNILLVVHFRGVFCLFVCFVFGCTLQLVASSSLTRDWVQVLGSESSEYQPLDHQRIP